MPYEREREDYEQPELPDMIEALTGLIDEEDDELAETLAPIRNYLQRQDREPPPIFNVCRPFQGTTVVQMNDAFADLLQGVLHELEGCEKPLERQLHAFKIALFRRNNLPRPQELQRI